MLKIRVLVLVLFTNAAAAAEPKKRVIHQIEPHHALPTSGGADDGSCVLKGSRGDGRVPAAHSLWFVVTRVMHEGVGIDD